MGIHYIITFKTTFKVDTSTFFFRCAPLILTPRQTLQINFDLKRRTEKVVEKANRVVGIVSARQLRMNDR